MESSKKVTIKALVVGATGATGRLLVDSLLKNQYYSEVHVLIRRKLDRWDQLDEIERTKLKMTEINDLSLLKEDREKILENIKNDFKIDTLFCCLGASDPTNEEELKKVDGDYVLYTASLCEKFDIPHFALISTRNANPNSCWGYLKLKGKVDANLILKRINRISIFRPPLLCDRENARLGEKIMGLIPFYPKISTRDVIHSMIYGDLDYTLSSQQTDNGVKIFEFSDLKEMRNKTFDI